MASSISFASAPHLARAREQRRRGVGRLERRRAYTARACSSSVSRRCGGVGSSSRSSRSSRPAATRASAVRRSSSSSGARAVDRVAHRPLGQPPERDELAARADRLGDRPEVVGDEHDHRVRRRLLEVLEQRVGRVVVHQVGAEDQVDAPVGLERPHVQVAAERADLVDADHLAERLELVDVGMLGARRAEQLARERAAERALADAVRPVEEVRVRRALVERRVEQALRLVLLGDAVCLGNAPVRPHAANLARRTRSAGRRRQRAVEHDVPLRAQRRRARGSRRRRGGRSRRPRARSGPGGRPRGARARPSGIEQQHERQVGREAAGRRRRSARERRRSRARARRPGRRATSRRSGRRRPTRRAASAGRITRSASSARAAANSAASAHAVISGPVEEQLADPLAERRAAGLAHRDDLVPLPGRPLREQRRLRRLAGAVDALERHEHAGPTIRTHAGGRDRWRRVHRVEPRRPPRRARRRGRRGRRPLDRQAREPRTRRDVRRARHPRRPRARARPTSSSTSPRRPTCRPRSRGPTTTRRSTSSAPCRCSRRRGAPARRSSSPRPAARSTASATARRPRTPRSRRSSPYGIAKLCAEQYLAGWNRIHGTGHVVLRFGNVFGPRQEASLEGGVVSIFLERMATRRADDDLRRRRPDPRLRLRRRRRRRAARGGRPRRRRLQRRHGPRDERARAAPRVRRGRGQRRGAGVRARRASARCAARCSTSRAPSASSAGAPRRRSTTGCARPGSGSRVRSAKDSAASPTKRPVAWKPRPSHRRS